jgi:excinuclease ABC subunit C
VSLPETVQSKLDSLPAKPGVYIFKDKKAAILYVGKAKSLRSRVRSYFQEGASDNRQFLPFLQKQVADLETRVTASEKEAAILEASLVKQYQPKFNVKLRDDKNFISLRLGLDHMWPRKFRRRPRATSGRTTPRRRRAARSGS